MALLLLLNGQIAGINGIVGGLLGKPSNQSLTHAVFILGLVLEPALFVIVAGHKPAGLSLAWHCWVCSTARALLVSTPDCLCN